MGADALEELHTSKPTTSGRLLTAHEAAEADAMRAALVSRLLDAAQWAAASWGDTPSDRQLRCAAWATVLALLLAPSEE